MTVQGKLQPIHVFSKTVTPRAGVNTGDLKDTLEFLPPRVAATELRNVVLALAITYRSDIKNNTQAGVNFAAREVHRSFGRIRYTDASGVVVPDMYVDELTSYNFADGLYGSLLSKSIGALGIVALGAGAKTTVEHTVVIAYADAFGTAKNKPDGRTDKGFAASLLGREAKLDFQGVGADLAADVEHVTSPEITVVAWCKQTKEVPIPTPMEYTRDQLDAGNDPFVQDGTPRKLECVHILSDTVGTVAVPVVLDAFASTDRLSVDVDGREAIGAPVRDMITANAMARPVEASFYPYGGAYLQDYYAGEMYTIIDPTHRDRDTMGESCTRLTVRGMKSIESGDVNLMQRIRRQCSPELFQRFCDREGIPAADRRDVRIGGRPAASVGLTVGEAIGVERHVGSRKSR